MAIIKAIKQLVTVYKNRRQQKRWAELDACNRATRLIKAQLRMVYGSGYR